MDINRLNEFLVLSECLNYSKAANLLYITQPVLSRHIHDLEDLLGTQLFVRDTHKVELTEVGRIAVDEIRTAVTALDNSFKNIRAATDSVNGSLKIGFLGHAVQPFLTKFIGEFSQQHPGLAVEYIAYDLDDLFRDLSDNNVDLGFATHLPLNRMDEFNSRQITKEQLCIVIPNGHPLQERDEVSMEDIAGEQIIAFSNEKNPITADFHKQLFEKFGMSMNVVRIIDKIETAIFYVGLGDGIFIIPRHLSFMVGNLKVLPIKDKEAAIPLILIWKKSSNKTVLQSFIKEFSKFYKALDS